MSDNTKEPTPAHGPDTTPGSTVKAGASGGSNWIEFIKWSHPHLRRVVHFLIMAIASFALSLKFQSLTDNALWLPTDWRAIVLTFTTLFGGLSALFVEKFWELKKVHAIGWFLRITIAIGCALIAIMVAVHTYDLKEECVYHLTVPAGWWESHFGDAAQVKPNAPDSTLADSFPSFLNRERNTILVPPCFDPAESNYLAILGHGSVRAGIVTVLDREPDQLIDWIKQSGQDYQEHYRIKFLLLNFILIFLLAGAYGTVADKMRIDLAAELVRHDK